jgi:hypothetical protein
MYHVRGGPEFSRQKNRRVMRAPYVSAETEIRVCSKEYDTQVCRINIKEHDCIPGFYFTCSYVQSGISFC